MLVAIVIESGSSRLCKWTVFVAILCFAFVYCKQACPTSQLSVFVDFEGEFGSPPDVFKIETC